MGIVKELIGSLYAGIQDGRKESLAEAPYIKETLGFYPSYGRLKNMPIHVGRLPDGVLGVTQITREGRAVHEQINGPYILEMAMDAARRYGKNIGKAYAYLIGKTTTNHEDYHVMSDSLARGEEISPKARDVMESVTTRGLFKVARRLGKHRKAEIVKQMNPYPGAWLVSNVADNAPYQGPSGSGYKGFLADAQKEKFYRPLGRLAWSAAKAGWRKAADYIGGRRPAYAAA